MVLLRVDDVVWGPGEASSAFDVVKNVYTDTAAACIDSAIRARDISSGASSQQGTHATKRNRRRKLDSANRETDQVDPQDGAVVMHQAVSTVVL